MHPDIAQALAEAHVSDLRRTAARQRLARGARTRQPLAVPGIPWGTLRSAAARLAAPGLGADHEPDCCPT